MNNHPAVPRGHVDFKAVLRDDRVFPHRLIRDYCPAIINFVDDDQTKCTRLLLALQVAAIGDFKAIVKPFLAFLLYGASPMSIGQ